MNNWSDRLACSSELSALVWRTAVAVGLYWEVREPTAWGCNRPTLFLGDINTGT
jgi:hypothetical protein